MTGSLGVDFGTSTTVAVVRRPDGRTRALLFDGSPLLSSAVLLGPDGSLHTGRDAAHLAPSFPDRLEPNPKRRIDEGDVLLGDREVPVRDLIAAVLRRVAGEAERVGVGTADVVLTHPVEWSRHRRAILVDAAERAGLGSPRLVAEPVAAATYFTRLGSAGGGAGPVLVYDLGAGTCDVTLLRRASPAWAPDRFEVIASAGLDDVGGLDVDAAIVAALQAVHGSLWTDADSRRQLWDEVRTAKEMLSRTSGTIVRVPALGAQVPLGRDEFDALARPVLARTVALVTRLLETAGRANAAPAALYLVGGSSRIPLVATMLHAALGIGPVVTEQPELVVAEGALNPELRESGEPVTGPVSTGAPPVAAVSPAPAASSPGPAPFGPPPPARPFPAASSAGPPGTTALPAPAPRPGDRLVRGVLVAVVLVLLAGFVGAGLMIRSLLDNDGKRAGPGSQTTPSTAGSAPASPSASPSGSAVVSTAAYRFADYGAICERVDTAAISKIFEKREGEPESNRSPGSSFGHASCLVGVTHVDGTGLADSIVILDFSVWIYEDVADAQRYHREHFDNATVNKQDPAAVTGLGDEAFTHRKHAAVTGPATQVEFTLEVRHSNLHFIAVIQANRIAEGGWSRANRTRIEAAFLESARATYARLAVK